MASIEILTSLSPTDETSKVGQHFGSVSLRLVDEDETDNAYIAALTDAEVLFESAGLSHYFSYAVTGTSIAFTNIRPIDFDDPDTPRSFRFTVAFDIDKVVVRDGVPTYTDVKVITKTFGINIADVNDETPSDLQLSNSFVAENALAGKVLGHFYAYDPDRGDLLTFRLLDDPSGNFELDGTRLVLKAGARLDYETQSSYDVTVEVEDAASHTIKKTLTIDVLDMAEAPTDVMLAGNTISEDAPSGTVVGTLSGIDPDGDPSRLTYTINQGSFSIEGDKIVLGEGKSLNFERDPSYVVTITARDADGAAFKKSFTIEVKNEIEISGTGAVDDVNGGGSGDDIWTFGGDDDIAAGGGDDKIHGGKGVDRITGGSGADSLAYAKYAEFGDIVRDFESGEDTFAFSAKLADKMRFNDLTPFFNKTVTGTGPTLSYQTDTGQLIFDPDGAGRKNGLLIATLLDKDSSDQGVQAGIASLTMDDFTIL